MHNVVAVDTRADWLDVVLWPVEARTVARATQRRRREFATGRACARRALARLGFPDCPVPAGPRGEPQWPEGIRGSITHCTGYRACAVARAETVAGIGIDAEPHAELPRGVLDAIAGPGERSRTQTLLQERPDIHWDRLIFSAKESAYKTWFPLVGRPVEFDEILIGLDPTAGTFQAAVRPRVGAYAHRDPVQLPGRWLVRDGLILTAVTLPSSWLADGAQVRPVA